MAGTPIDPSYQFIEVDPSDTAILSYNNMPLKCKGIYVAVAGDLTVDDDLGNPVTFINIAAGVIHPISTQRIRATGTAATGIVALF